MQDLRAVLDLQRKLGARVLFEERRQHVRCEILRGRDDADIELAVLLAAHRGEALIELVELLLHAARVHRDRFAGVGQAQLPADQLRQRQPAFLLQRLQLHRDGRLRQMADAGRGRNAAQARNLLENAKLAQRHAFHGVSDVSINLMQRHR